MAPVVPVFTVPDPELVAIQSPSTAKQNPSGISTFPPNWAAPVPMRSEEIVVVAPVGAIVSAPVASRVKSVKFAALPFESL
jgi:hypothetical protein